MSDTNELVERLRPLDLSVPVVYQQRRSRDDGKTWSDWYPTTREAFEEYTRNVASRYVSGKWTFEARALYALPPAQAGNATEAISAQDPLTILAGIEQFGLAADGSDLRDLREALTAALGAQTSPERAVTEAHEKMAVLDGGQYAVCLDGRWRGWLFRRHADGYWVSQAKLPLENANAGSPLTTLLAAAPTPPVNQSEGADRG